MNHLLKHLLSIVLLYLAFAFVEAEFNPFEWDEQTRFGLVYCCAFTVCMIVIYEMINKNDKK